MSLCTRRFTGVLGLDGPRIMPGDLAVTGLATGMTAGPRLLTRRVLHAPGADATGLMCCGPAAPKWLIHHFAVKALLTLI